MPATTFSHRPPRTWLKVSFSVPATLTESAAAFLADLSSSGVEIVPEAERHADLACEKIIGYLPGESNIQQLLEQLNTFLNDLQQSIPQWPSPTVHSETILEEDWGITWKEHFKPARITERLVVKPTWEEYVQRPNELILELDPGMAFGTGLHASTRLALEIVDHLYQTQTVPPQTVLDVGTGTGILAMAAALFGARQAVAIDNDPDAVAAAQANVAYNHLDTIVTVSDKALAAIDLRFDLVIANITRDTIIELAPMLKKTLQPDASLILSGILQGEQEESICLAMAALDLTLVAPHYQDEWFAGRFISVK